MSRFDSAQRDIFFVVLFFSLSSFAYSQSHKHELRAVWISSASGDWPKSTDVAEQQRSLVEIFDVLKNNNFNTVFFQVRPRGNVLYRSSIEPWATQLTGVLGKDPGYDPLAFAIEEAHKRGLELHAWFNVAKVWGNDNLPQNQQHVTRAHRDWVKQYENEWWIDLGNPEARVYSENLVKELVQSYDIDGIHFDYVRYPSEKFDDWDSFNKWSDGIERAEWRRNNVTAFVRACYEFIQNEKPWIKVGSAPLGIYQSIIGAQSSFNGYSGVFQDSRKWLREGIHDYVAPQLYWTIGEQKNPNDPDFTALCGDWMRENYGRHVYIGIGAYRENIQNEIREQIAATRNVGAQGQAFFRYEHVSSILNQIGSAYKYPDIVPPMMWKDSVPPNTPKDISLIVDEHSTTIIKWNEPELPKDNEKPSRYVVYRSSVKKIDMRRAENILAILPATQRSYRDETTNGKEYFYSVTALDRAGNESGITERPAAELLTLLSRYAKPQLSATLSQNVPNPFSISTYIAFEIPQRSVVLMTLTHTITQQETIIVKETKEAGVHIVSVNLKNFPVGMIECSLKTGETIAKKMIEKR